jgi:hypothetical protein
VTVAPELPREGIASLRDSNGIKITKAGDTEVFKYKKQHQTQRNTVVCSRASQLIEVSVKTEPS